jgi:hypothetical protein
MTSMRNRKKGLLILIVLAIVTFFILNTGCTHVPFTANTTNPDSTSIRQNEQNNSLQNYWISINPINNVTRGERIRISGSTDLPVNTELAIQVYCTECFNWHQKSRAGEFYGNTTTTSVVPGSMQVNVYSVDVNTSEYIPDEYHVSVQRLNDSRYNETHFFLLNTSDSMR